MISSDSLAHGCSRVDDFASVNYLRSSEEKEEAMSIFLQSIGINDELQDQLDEWAVNAIGPDADVAAILIGVIIGTFAAEYGK